MTFELDCMVTLNVYPRQGPTSRSQRLLSQVRGDVPVTISTGDAIAAQDFCKGSPLYRYVSPFAYKSRNHKSIATVPKVHLPPLFLIRETHLLLSCRAGSL